MKNQKFVGLGIFVLLTLALIPFMSATTTANVPAANGNYSTTLDLNVTTDLANTLNVTCYYNSTGGAATTLLTSVANTSASQTEFTDSVDISGLTDSATYNVSCDANSASTSETDSNTGITFDSTDPTVNLFVDLGGDSASYGSLIEYSCTTSDSIDSSPTETFNVSHPSGDSPSSTSLTLQSTKLQFLDTDFEGDYVFTCTSTDYTGNEGSDSATVTVNELGEVIRVGGDSDNGMNTNTILIVVGGGLVAWLLFRKK